MSEKKDFKEKMDDLNKDRISYMKGMLWIGVIAVLVIILIMIFK